MAGRVVLGMLTHRNNDGKIVPLAKRPWAKSINQFNIAAPGGYSLGGRWIGVGEHNNTWAFSGHENTMCVLCADIPVGGNFRIAFVIDTDDSKVVLPRNDYKIEWVAKDNPSNVLETTEFESEYGRVVFIVSDGTLPYNVAGKILYTQNKGAYHPFGVLPFQDNGFGLVSDKTHISPPFAKAANYVGDMRMKCNNAAYFAGALAAYHSQQNANIIDIPVVAEEWKKEDVEIVIPKTKTAETERVSKVQFKGFESDATNYLNFAGEKVVLPRRNYYVKGQAVGGLAVILDAKEDKTVSVFNMLDYVNDNWQSFTPEQQRTWLAIFENELRNVENLVQTARIACSAVRGLSDNES